MNTFHLATSLALSLLGSLAASAQSTWYVDAAAAPPGNGTPASPYASIQYAHDQPTTLSGDTLAIATGTYDEPLVFAQGKALNLVGAGTLSTLLRGGLEVLQVAGITRVAQLAITEQPASFQQSDVELLDVAAYLVDSGPSGIALTVSGAGSTWTQVSVGGNPGGGAAILGGSAVMQDCVFGSNGGAIGGLFASISTLSLTNCLFQNNDVVGGHGGGLHADGSQIELVDCTFLSNSASVDGRLGGALYLGGGQLSITGGSFRFNHSDRGGAIALLGEATLNGVAFEDNSARIDGSNAFISAQGGAIYVGFAGKLTATDCFFSENLALHGFPALPADQIGGAIYATAPGSTVRDSHFADNAARFDGAAVYGPVDLVNCLLEENDCFSGSTMVGGSLERCTVFKGATGAGAPALVDVAVSSSIVWGHMNGSLGGTSTAAYSCIQFGAPGVGNIADYPQFLDFPQDDVHLTMASPCIDAADPSLPLDGDLTPADMGALPFTWQPIGASYCSSNPNSSGQTAVMAVLGSTLAADDFVRVQATQTASNQIGLFLMSQNQGFVPFFNGSQGNLCLSGPILRIVGLPDSVGSSGDLGVLNTRLQLANPPYGPSVLAGQTWNFQAWFRDVVAGQNTSNTSDAVSITFQ
ncbi:MAG TPA: hypothetical protein VMT18_11555 [Planctomycetota bacterium]|nr:hypothetical protein [Planctomycetota bacterium]